MIALLDHKSNIQKIFKTSILVMVILSSISLVADEDVNGVKVTDVEKKYTEEINIEKSKNLKQSINFGFANTTGNTDTLNFNGKYTLDYTLKGYDGNDLNIGIDASAFLTKDDSTTTNEEYFVKLSMEQELQDNWGAYLFTSWLRNEFRNFDNKVMVGAGARKLLLYKDTHSLKIKLGVAYNFEEYSNEQENSKFGSFTQYLEYVNTLSTNNKFYLKAGASESFDDFTKDYELLGIIGLILTVTEDIHVVIEEEVFYNALPPIGFKKTDTKSIIRVGYKF